MPQYTLTVLDTSQIQGYVFGSNRLVENIGASELVELATHQWVYEALPEPHNAGNPKQRDGGLRSDLTLPEARAEVVYAGGGNTVLLFREHGDAVAFARRLTRHVLEEAPGLQVVLAHRDFEWDHDVLGGKAGVVQETLGGLLARKKGRDAASMPLLATPVTAACASTGRAAAQLDDEGRPISREIGARVKAGVQESAEKRMFEALPRVNKDWQVSHDFEDLGRERDEESYLAVVHADGNRMGRRVLALAGAFEQHGQNRAYITAMRDFSALIEQVSSEALAQAVDPLVDHLARTVTRASQHGIFPFRPVVFGGDDVTFVCHGRYGLPLAAGYLRAFNEKSRKPVAAFYQALLKSLPKEIAADREKMAKLTVLGQPLHAAAGVCIFKTHYPFARAYRLAAALAETAKDRVSRYGTDAGALDWHFARTGITGSLKRIREREYTAPTGSLVMRPVLLDEPAAGWRSWETFATLTDAFTKEDGEWYGRRNKVKALRAALREGPDAVEEFRHTYRLPALPSARDLDERATLIGWAPDGDVMRCAYFDAVEAMDLWEGLEPPAEPEPAEGGAYAHA